MTLRFGQKLAIGAIAWLTLAAGSGPALAAAPAWPQAASEIAADPAVRFGVLPNGLRYAIMHNDSPKGQVAMRLQVLAGSMHERPGQEGLAHFIEHMAFRGTTHAPDGQMVQSLQRLGLQFGADTNAGTSQLATTYMFNLPRSDEPSIETGLMLLRDIASEITLDAAVARTESGVVLSEERTRAGEQLNAAKAGNDLLYGAHPYARLPIGRTDVIAAADVKQMRAFYDAYYRPERSVLVVVGDVDAQAIEAKIRAGFSNWAGKGPAGPDPAPLTAAGRTTQFAAVDGKPLFSEVRLAWIKPYDLPVDSEAQALDRLTRLIAQNAFSSRLSAMSNEAGRPFGGASLSQSTIPGVSKTVALSVIQVNDWKAGLALLVKAQRQLAAYGFTQEELDRVLAQGRAVYKSGADSAATRPSSYLADSLIASATNGQVFRTPAEIFADFNRLAPQITLDRVNAKAAELFVGAGPLVFVSAPGAPQADIGLLRATYETAAKAPVERRAQVAALPWRYTDFGKPGAVVEQQEVAGLGIVQVRFANGVRLGFKRNISIQNEVLVRVQFGHGYGDLPADRPGMASAAVAILSTGTPEGYSSGDLSRTLAGKQASVSFNLTEREFVANGATRPEDLATQLQLLAARFSSPAWQPNLYLASRDDGARMIAALGMSPGLAYASQSGQLLHNGDLRWRTPTLEELSALPADSARALVEPILSHAPLEVLISGDTTLDVAISEVAKTFGALPPRDAEAKATTTPAPVFPAPTAEPVTITHAGRADQALAAIAWPIRDAREGPVDPLTADILASVMRSRLIEQLRSHDGKTYSPNVTSSFSKLGQSYGYIQAQAEVAAVDVDAFYAKAKAVAADLAASPISADELNRAVAPIAETYLRNKQNNVYWLNWMGRLSYSPWAPAHMRTMPADLTEITPAQVQEAARRWLAPSKAWSARVIAANTSGASAP